MLNFLPVRKFKRNGTYIVFGTLVMVVLLAVYQGFKATSESSGTDRVFPKKSISWENVPQSSVSEEMISDQDQGKEVWSPQNISVEWSDEFKGQANLHVFEEWCGSSVAQLRKNPHYPLHPHTRTTVKKLAVSPTWTNYGLRIFGYIHPYSDGDFLFALASDDNSEFWLSDDDSLHNLKLRAYVGKTGREWTAPGEYWKYANQTSDVIPLQKDRKYFFELIHKQDDGGTDHVELAWALKAPASEFSIVQSKYISLYINESSWKAADVTITPQTAASHVAPPKVQYQATPPAVDLLRIDPRDSFHLISLLNRARVQDFLPNCNYLPSYILKGFHLMRYQGLHFVQLSYVYPNDYTRLTHMEGENKCFYRANSDYMDRYGFSSYIKQDLPPESDTFKGRKYYDPNVGWNGKADSFQNDVKYKKRSRVNEEFRSEVMPDYSEYYESYLNPRKLLLVKKRSRKRRNPDVPIQSEKVPVKILREAQNTPGGLQDPSDLVQNQTTRPKAMRKRKRPQSVRNNPLSLTGQPVPGGQHRISAIHHHNVTKTTARPNPGRSEVQNRSRLKKKRLYGALAQDGGTKRDHGAPYHSSDREVKTVADHKKAFPIKHQQDKPIETHGNYPVNALMLDGALVTNWAVLERQDFGNQLADGKVFVKVPHDRTNKKKSFYEKASITTSNHKKIESKLKRWAEKTTRVSNQHPNVAFIENRSRPLESWSEHGKVETLKPSYLNLANEKVSYNPTEARRQGQLPSTLSARWRGVNEEEPQEMEENAEPAEDEDGWVDDGLSEEDSNTVVHRAVFDPEVNWSQTFNVEPLDLHRSRSDGIDLKCNVSGNMLLDQADALMVVEAFMKKLDRKYPRQFSLKRVVNVEKRADYPQGSRYLLELELQEASGRHLRLSQYIYVRSAALWNPTKPDDSKLHLCSPIGFFWNPSATVHFIVPVKNQARWVQKFISDMEQLYHSSGDQNFNIIIIDYDSTDMNIEQALENSYIPRHQYKRLSGRFERSAGLQAGIDLITDHHSIVFLCDLHIHFPPGIIDTMRKHCVEGHMAFAPIVMRLNCGATPQEPYGYWEVNGFGLLAIYKSDLDSIGGMNTEEYRDRWGGEDWELLDRILEGGLEVERLYLRNFFHYFHSKRGMWNRQILKNT